MSTNNNQKPTTKDDHFFLDDLFYQDDPSGGFFDFNNDGKLDLGEEWVANKILDDIDKETKAENENYSSSYHGSISNYSYEKPAVSLPENVPEYYIVHKSEKELQHEREEQTRHALQMKERKAADERARDRAFKTWLFLLVFSIIMEIVLVIVTLVIGKDNMPPVSGLASIPFLILIVVSIFGILNNN